MLLSSKVWKQNHILEGDHSRLPCFVNSCIESLIAKKKSTSHLSPFTKCTFLLLLAQKRVESVLYRCMFFPNSPMTQPIIWLSLLAALRNIPLIISSSAKYAKRKRFMAESFELYSVLAGCWDRSLPCQLQSVPLNYFFNTSFPLPSPHSQTVTEMIMWECPARDEWCKRGHEKKKGSEASGCQTALLSAAVFHYQCPNQLVKKEWNSNRSFENYKIPS